MLPWKGELAGRLEERTIVSEQLRDNPLGDPHERPLWVYLPPGYDDPAETTERYPCVYVIQGYTGHVAMWFNRTPFRRPFPELADDVFKDGTVPKAIVVLVDAWTSVGGSQFLDSPGTGRYHTYLCEEVVSFVDANYRTIADRDHRGIAGKSSGGYGAMVNAMLRPDVFGSMATHAGDALFDLCYRTEFGKRARILRDRYDGSYDKFFEDFRGRIPGTKDSDFQLMEMYAYAAAYSADDDGTVRMPFDDVGATVPEVWQRWVAWDPVVMAEQPRYAEALRSLNSIWIDAGSKDEYYLDLGATAFHRRVLAAGVPEDRIHYELFEAGHGLIEYRYPLALAWMCKRFS
jgi:S-formylglutathione hydrolase FrmB